MIKPIKFPFFLALIVVFTCSCDIIVGPKKDYSNVSQNSDKKIVIEEFTGHYCGNCPDGQAKAEELDSIFGDNLIVIGMHGGSSWFSIPHPPLYTADYRTQMAIDLDTYFNLESGNGYPIGLVNRREFSGAAPVKYTNWATAVATLLTEVPTIGITLTSAVNSTNDTANIGVHLEYFAEGSASDNLVVVIKEDSVISPQVDYDLPAPQNDTFYVHMDMHRATLSSGTWGDPVKASAPTIGEHFQIDFSFPLNPIWVTKNCEVVAYVMDNITKEILQAEEVKLK